MSLVSISQARCTGDVHFRDDQSLPCVGNYAAFSALVTFTLICFGLAPGARFSDAHGEQQQFQTPLECDSI